MYLSFSLAQYFGDCFGVNFPRGKCSSGACDFCLGVFVKIYHRFK